MQKEGILENLLELLSSAQALTTIFGVSIAAALAFFGKQALSLTQRRQCYADQRYFGLDYTKVRVAIAASDLPPRLLGSMRSLYKNREELIHNSLIQWQHSIANNERERFASGSRTFRLRDLLQHDRFQIPVTLRSIETSLEIESSEVLNTLTGLLETALNARIAIVGDAGFGKSFLCSRAFDDLVMTTSDRIAVLIRAEDVELLISDEHKPFSVQAAAELVARKALGDARLPIDVLVIERLLKRSSVLIVDGLDEIIPRIPLPLTPQVFDSWVLSECHLVTTRFWHYQNLRDHTNVFSSRDTYTNSRLTRQDAQLFLREALDYLHLPQEASLHFDTFRSTVARIGTDSTGLVSLRPDTTLYDPPAISGPTPLLLMMLVEVSKNAIGGYAAEMTVDIFSQFAQDMLVRELVRDGVTEHTTTARHFLQDVAWLVFTSRDVVSGDLLLITEADVQDLISSYSGDSPQLTPTLNRLTTDSAFIRRRSNLVGGVNLIGFTHQSFLEYFVSERFRDWMIGERNTGDDFLDHIETPEVTVFIKEHLHRIGTVPALKRSAATTLASQLELDMEWRSTATTELERRRATFRVGQVIYHLAMFESPDHPIIARALSDPAVWIRQTAAIGLAFGGHPEPLDTYIDVMRSGIRNGDFTLAGAHIATQVAFYGDQEFDPLDPTRDLGLPSCRKLITRIVHELWLSAEAANWRINLFDIVFLSKYRPCSYSSFVDAFEEIRESLVRVLPLLAERHGEEAYPEIREVRCILNGEDVDSL